MIYTRYLLLIVQYYPRHIPGTQIHAGAFVFPAVAKCTGNIFCATIRDKLSDESDHDMASDRKYRPRLRDHSERRSGAPLRILERKD
jgi:hypothetical protein